MISIPRDLSLPDRDTVLSQAIPFNRSRWMPLLPDTTWWPAELDTCPVVGKWPRVDRRTVIGIARKWDTVEGRRHLLVASLVWGAGTKARSVSRCARALGHLQAADIDARLEAALTMLRAQGATESFWAFNNEHHIPYLGAAFFTKVLYFAGAEHLVGPPKPLILDSVVSRALKDLGAADADWPENGWKTDQYKQYVEALHNYAIERDALPDQVEAALFFHGKSLSASQQGPSKGS